MSETALVHACLIYLKTQGCMAWRCNTGAMTLRAPGKRSRFVRFNTPGTADIIGFGPPPEGRGIAVECKRPGNTPTALQTQFLRAAQAQGAFACWVTSVTQLAEAWEAWHHRQLDVGR